MTIEEIQAEVIDEFVMFDDWMDRYQYIIDMSKGLPIIDEALKTDQYKIKGCQSSVWLNAEYTDGKIYFTADSDAVITKGIVAMLVRVLSGHTPQEIQTADLHFIGDIGLKENLSPTRSNGLLAMIKQMRIFALAFEHSNK